MFNNLNAGDSSASYNNQYQVSNNTNIEKVNGAGANSTEYSHSWKREKKLFIYINPKHQAAPPAALAALLSHEALHQDEYNSLSEETFAWTMEAVVWIDLLEIYPECNVESNALVKRENTLKKLFEKGNNSPKYIKKSVYQNKGYQGLPLTSPGFQEL